MRVLLLFLDGVGIGRRDVCSNPFFAADFPGFMRLLEGRMPSLRQRSCSGDHCTLMPLDATLGMPGLPQSGTGQTALFTGHNGARLAGKHFGPYPYSTLRPVIKEHNIFRQLAGAGKRALFANAFPQRFFDYMERHASRLTVTTLSCSYAGVPLLREADLREGKAVSADITGEGWKSLGHPEVPLVRPREAGKLLVGLLESADFVLFEYWKTDHAGHTQSMHEALTVLRRFDEMLEGVLEHLNLRTSLLVLVSDHGNLEDLTTKTHTRNPVPAIFYGHRHQDLAWSIRNRGGRRPNLSHFTPALMEQMGAYAGQSGYP